VPKFPAFPDYLTDFTSCPLVCDNKYSNKATKWHLWEELNTFIIENINHHMQLLTLT